MVKLYPGGLGQHLFLPRERRTAELNTVLSNIQWRSRIQIPRCHFTELFLWDHLISKVCEIDPWNLDEFDAKTRSGDDLISPAVSKSTGTPLVKEEEGLSPISVDKMWSLSVKLYSNIFIWDFIEVVMTNIIAYIEIWDWVKFLEHQA